MEIHEKYMKRCIELASNGLGYTTPNPMVGCIIVHKGVIIGEGFHREYGKAHAEVNAINSVKNPELLPHSTLYVSLEPCSHFGKTPPCTDLIIQKGIKNVIIGSKDININVSGNGIEKLRKHNISVLSGILEQECNELNKRFICYHLKKRPYIVLKWAQTADAYIDTDRDISKTTRPTWITSENLKMLVHQWRHDEQAIIVGTNTALADNPKLNIREWHGKNPIRIVIDQKLSLPKSLALFDNSIPSIIFNEKEDKVRGNSDYIKIDFNKDPENRILEILYEKQIQSLIIEGGQILLQSFIDKGLWDEARVFHGNQYFGKGKKAPEIHSNTIYNYVIENEKLSHLINEH
ncbi:MAG: bifunctional diaminohydroxyphosphoribosylaminopyrimidine deaminase/5-amino-6-(5-phosphoribosylamino)uracil reductase RibD [Bacteroidota bacterium]